MSRPFGADRAPLPRSGLSARSRDSRRAAYRRAAARLTIGALALTVVTLGCDKGGGSTTPPPTGLLVAELITPNAAARDGAILITIAGPAAPALAAGSPYLVHGRAQGGGVTVAVFGSLAAGPLFRLQIPSAADAGRYSATISEIAMPDGTIRSNLDGYEVRLRTE